MATTNDHLKQSKRQQLLISVTETDPNNITVWQKILSAICLGVFVMVWISSIVSPVLLLLAIVQQCYIMAVVIVMIFILAYIPWKKENSIIASTIHKTIQTNSPLFFKSLKIHFVQQLPNGQESTSSTSSSQQKQQQEQQQQQTPTFYAIHPHGCFCMGWGQLFCHDVMQNVRFCFSPALYASPFFRLFSRCTGNPGSASKHDMQSYFASCQDIALPPGGFEEATLSCMTQDRVYIHKRTGFIRLCLQYGYTVRPVYCFGEKSLFWNIQGMERVRLALNRYGIPTILAWGQVLIPVLPKRNGHLYIVCGAPITLPKITNPTKADVQKWHATYMTELVKLFEEYKEAAYGSEIAKTTKLELW
jgi:Diacylglycerol acyltransferase